MNENDAQTNDAWEELEQDLLAQKWIPSQPKLQPFGFPEEGSGIGLHKLARAYMAENETKIRKVVCEGNSVKIEIVTASGSISAVSDALIAAGMPLVSVANLLCVLGLTKFCQSGPSVPPAAAPVTRATI